MNRKSSHSDLPLLRSLRDVYRRLLDQTNALKAGETSMAMLLAYCVIIDDLQANFDRVGKVLTQLEHTPPSSSMMAREAAQ